MKTPIRILLIAGALICLMLLLSCSQSAQEDPPKKDDSVIIRLYVDHDDLFGHDMKDQVAVIFFSDTRGLVGSPVTCAIDMDKIQRFDETEILFELELENNNAILYDDYVIEHVFKREKSEFEFIIPQVVTMPAVLNFNVYLTVGDPETDDYFQASGYYQFFINQGAPAT